MSNHNKKLLADIAKMKKLWRQPGERFIKNNKRGEAMKAINEKQEEFRKENDNDSF